MSHTFNTHTRISRLDYRKSWNLIVGSNYQLRLASGFITVLRVGRYGI